MFEVCGLTVAVAFFCFFFLCLALLLLVEVGSGAEVGGGSVSESEPSSITILVAGFLGDSEECGAGADCLDCDLLAEAAFLAASIFDDSNC